LIRRIRTIFALPMVLGMSCWGAAAQEQTPSTRRFSAWEIVCAPPGTDAPSCRLTQRLVVKDSNETVFLATVLPAEKKGQFVAILSAPLGGYVTPGMELRIDQGKPFRVLFETCNSAGCHGGFELGGRVLKEMQGGKTLVVRLWTAKNAPVDVKISLEGFGPAFTELRGRS
jgi:invasion protein IalB